MMSLKAGIEATSGKASRRSEQEVVEVVNLHHIIRMSESLAKMDLQPLASEKHVDEAFVFSVFPPSKLRPLGILRVRVEGFTSDTDQESMQRSEAPLKKSYSEGIHVSELVIIHDLVTGQHYNETLVKKVWISLLVCFHWMPDSWPVPQITP
ncbi:unnamed protein product [Heligmosomoides polygyrus]|uniref:MCM_lid domain-containing protein n=1 Tax=Heligmosomoides polygyrus TaxID=6339 RepID=A0A183F4R1_HELPZ|nr:unnamed protein product [Heligmosomoides polygyrus]